MYVTLEPCTHQGRTPPCVDAIIEKGVGKVVIAALDPNPVVFGRGRERLLAAGIEVEVGLQEQEARIINREFFKYMQEGKPWVIAKYAMTMDGRVATASGRSRWITGEKAREMVHRLRREVQAVVVGRNTLDMDNPGLDCRLENSGPEYQPVRIVLSRSGNVSPSARIFQLPGQAIVVSGPGGSARATEQGLTAVDCGDERCSVDAVLSVLAEQSIISLLLEGGPRTISEFVAAGAVDEVVVCVAPRIIGNGAVPVSGLDTPNMDRALQYQGEWTVLGQDVCFHGFPL